MTNQSYDQINLARKTLNQTLQAKYRKSYVKSNLIHFLLKARTRRGREAVEQIEGFKLFLTRLTHYPSHSQQQTPALFEKYLPYAMALDVEKQWGEQFNDILQNGVSGRPYQPLWYTGPMWSSITMSALLSSYLNGTLTRALSSACISSSANDRHPS